MQAVGGAQNYRNDVFISYSEGDEIFAEKLANFLKRYKTPRGLRQKNGGKLAVFKDTNGLGDTEYSRFIEQQLLYSRKLIVICSPNARKSEAVNQRIRRFVERNGSDNIIPVIVEGHPGKETGAEPEEQSAIPESLRQAVKIPPVNNYSGFDTHKDKFHKGAFESEWYSLLANLFDVDRIEIAQLDRDARFQQKRRRLLAIISMVLLAFSAFGILSWRQNSIENSRREKALAQLAGDFWQKSRQAREENKRLLSLHLAAEALSMIADEELKKGILRDVAPYQPVSSLSYILPHKGEIFGSSFNKNKSRILTWGSDSSAHLWNAADGVEKFPPLHHNGRVYGAIFTRDETRILTWSTDSTARLWDAHSGKPVSSPLQHAAAVVGAVFSEDENRLLTWCDDFSAQMWDITGSQPSGAKIRHSGWINGAAFTKDGTQFLTWSDDSTIGRWEARSGKPAGSRYRHSGTVNGLVFNDNQNRFLSWCSDGTAQLRETQSGSPAGAVLRHGGAIIGACFDKAETRILTWSTDNTARLWNVNSGKETVPPLTHDGWVLGAAFNQSEARILTWSHDNTARLWNAADGKQIGPPMSHSSGPLGNDAGIFGAAFDQSETRILTWGDDNTARLWDVETGRQIGVPLQHDNGKGLNHEIEGAIFDPELACILTWSNDSTARFWKTLPYQSNIDSNREADVDPDFPGDKFELQLMALSGTEYHPASGEVECIEPQRWFKLKEEYQQIAREHYKVCKYPRQNLWRRFFPEEAEKIRPLSN